MFNKKKRHFNNQFRPHYTRQPGGPDNPDDPKPAPGETQNPGGTNQPENAAPAVPQPPVQAETVSIPVEPSPDNVPVQSAQPFTAPANGVTLPQQSVPGGPPDVSMCPICAMPIRSVNTAVHQKDTGSLVHFDCALRELSKEYYPKLGRFKKIYYIGAGNFAVVKEFYDKRGHLKNYEILEKIPYEPKEK